METWSAVALALALSVDGLAVGVAYGMRRIHVPARSLVIIGLCSASCFFVAMTLGEMVARVAGFKAPHIVGACILVALGCWNIGKGWVAGRSRETAAGAVRTEQSLENGTRDIATVFRIRIRRLGIVVEVLREPGRADVDQSGAIDAREAILLGAALGLDALAAGFGAAFVGLRLPVVVAVAAAQVALTWLGLTLGRDYGARWLGQRGFYVPGVILILVGLLQL